MDTFLLHSTLNNYSGERINIEGGLFSGTFSLFWPNIYVVGSGLGDLIWIPAAEVLAETPLHIFLKNYSVSKPRSVLSFPSQTRSFVCNRYCV